MKIIIVGLGQTGKLLAVVASKEHHEVVVVDNNKEVVEQMTEKYNAEEDVLALKMPGAGGGGYLALVVKDSKAFCDTHSEAIELHIRRQ